MKVIVCQHKEIPNDYCVVYTNHHEYALPYEYFRSRYPDLSGMTKHSFYKFDITKEVDAIIKDRGQDGNAAGC